jgi:hypothetical protein
MTWAYAARASAMLGLVSGVFALFSAAALNLVPEAVGEALVDTAWAGTGAGESGFDPRLDSVIGALVEDAPFRATREPSRRRFEPQQPQDAVALQRPPAPALYLAGIVWSSRPVAVVGGIPGTTGPRVMHPGDTLGGVRLHRLTQGGAALTGYDTTWSLTLGRAGP